MDLILALQQSKLWKYAMHSLYSSNTIPFQNNFHWNSNRIGCDLASSCPFLSNFKCYLSFTVLLFSIYPEFFSVNFLFECCKLFALVILKILLSAIFMYFFYIFWISSNLPFIEIICNLLICMFDLLYLNFFQFDFHRNYLLSCFILFGLIYLVF